MSGVEEKAVRLLATGRVKVIEAAPPGSGRAVVKGDHASYEVRFTPEWISCPCPSWRACSHKRAVALVVEASDNGGVS